MNGPVSSDQSKNSKGRGAEIQRALMLQNNLDEKVINDFVCLICGYR